MQHRERRTPAAIDLAALRAALTPAQRNTLAMLEAFQWTLRFVQRPSCPEPVPVVVDRSGRRCAVLAPDGDIDQNPGFRLRD